MTDFQIRLRSHLFRGMALIAFMVLATQLWNLQVIQGETYRALADANRFRLNQVSAARGIIYDRNNKLLVRNRPTYNVVIIPAYLPEDATAEAKVIARLSELLNLPITTQIEPAVGSNNGYFQAITHHQFNRQLRRQIINPRSRQLVNAPQGIRDAVNQNRLIAPFLPVIIARDVDPIIVSQIEEEHITLPGVLIDTIPARDYLYGELMSHLLGYVGPIPSEQFERYQERGYDLIDTIGLAGIESSYEEWLHGIKGLENIEVDVTGQKIRTVSENIQVQPGHNLQLSIDLGLQEATAQALQEEMDLVNSNQGVAIAMNPQTGEILAMVSLPSYDNNSFARGISTRELSLLSDDPWTPLVNHAIAGVYPPGSTFKIIPAAGALQERTVYSDTIFVDEGTLYLPNQFEPDNLDLAQPFYCWLRTGHGPVNLVAALAFSCDVYFYQVGGGYYPAEYEGLGLERMGKYAEMFGLGEPSGIDIPGEAAGLVPNQKWKRINYAETWLTGDTYNMAIGQGFVLATPLQIVNAYAAIANGGTLYRPYLVKEILDADDNVIKVNEPQVIRKLAVEPQFMALVQEGLRNVIAWEAGTAYDNFDVPGIIASGKTGTAEFCDRYPQCLDRDGRVKTSHAWFISYAPSNNPTIATVVFIYGGGGAALEGSEVAVPVTNKILRYYFNIKDENEAAAPEATEEPVATISPEATFTSRLLGTDSWSHENASVSGFVLDAAGQGVPQVRIDVLANNQVVAQINSGLTGQFDYTELDPNLAATWELRLPDYPGVPPLQLEIGNGLRYLVEFKAQPATDTPAAAEQ